MATRNSCRWRIVRLADLPVQARLVRRSALLALGLGLLAAIVPYDQWIAAFNDLTTGSVQVVVSYLAAWGWWTPLISAVLLILQAVIPPLPSTPLVAANGILFGIWPGALLSWVAALAGAAVSFGLARWGGRRWLPHPEKGGGWFDLDRMNDATGFWIVLVARLTPIVSLDAVGYVAGLGTMRFRAYLLACAIGQTPSILAYTMLGYDLAHAQLLSWRVAWILIGGVCLLIFGKWWLKREKVWP
ncbi:MAG: TVP38/TMEM64 family protein [Caldilineaceae bacterium]|nr:TVP38/TMEM64 family protein [Caldilineaceae bacterium]